MSPRYTGIVPVRGVVPSGVVATRPTPPSSYTPPAGTSITTQAGLRAALASGTPATIIVENGTYSDALGYMTVGAAHQVYGRNLLGAEIRNGVQSGSSTGVLFRGLKFNVTDSAQLLSNYISHMWGTSSGWQYLDCTFWGNDSISAGIAVRGNPAYEGLIIRRCEAHNFHEWGFLIDSNDTSYVPTTLPILEDIYTANCVYQTNPQGSNGVSEAGLWVGARATINRCWFHQDPGYATLGASGTLKAWQGLWIGTNFLNSTVNDIYVDGYIAFGVYGYGPLNADDVSTVTFNRLETAFPVNVGFHLEWNNPGAGHHPNCQNVIVQDSKLWSTCVGVHFDQGTVHSTARRCTFIGQHSAGINNYLQGTPNNLYDTSGNDYSGMISGSNITTDYAGSYACWNNDLYI